MEILLSGNALMERGKSYLITHKGIRKKMGIKKQQSK